MSYTYGYIVILIITKCLNATLHHAAWFVQNAWICPLTNFQHYAYFTMRNTSFNKHGSVFCVCQFCKFLILRENS